MPTTMFAKRLMSLILALLLPFLSFKEGRVESVGEFYFTCLNVEFVSLVWISNHPSNVVVALTLSQNVVENKNECYFHSLGIFCSFAFHFNQHFLLGSFLCVFCQYFEKSEFLRFQTFTNVR